MREILFAGIEKKSENWVYGHFVHNDIDCPCIIDKDAKKYEIHPDTLSQYTGLKDKKGNMIFEGDILQVCDNKNGVLTVEFRNAYVGGWVLTHESTDQVLSLGARKSEDLELIGNIHNNK